MVFIIFTINLSLFHSFISILGCLVVAVVCCFQASLILFWAHPFYILSFHQRHAYVYSHRRLTGSDSHSRKMANQCSAHEGGYKHFRGGPNISVKFGPGPNYYRGPNTWRQVTCNTETRGPNQFTSSTGTSGTRHQWNMHIKFWEATSQHPPECCSY